MSYYSRYFKYLTYKHYNNKKERSWSTPVWGIAFNPAERVGINLDIYLGHHTFAFWVYPTRKYGRDTR